MGSISVCVTFLLIAGCSGVKMADYVAIHQDGVARLPAAQQIDEHYTEVDHFITHLGFGKQPLTWNTKAYIEGRFVLSLQVPVTVDYESQTIMPSGQPTFYLHATKQIRISPDGTAETTYDGALQRVFGQAEWDKFVRSEFDLTSLGIPNAEVHPIPHFDEYVQTWRKDRIPIK